MSKTIEDLRAALFETLQGIKNGSIDLDKARTINEIGKTLTETAKVEVAFLQATGGEKSAFIAPAKEPAPESGELPPGITGIRQHRIGG
jgi:hypothetical protein